MGAGCSSEASTSANQPAAAAPSQPPVASQAEPNGDTPPEPSAPEPARHLDVDEDDPDAEEADTKKDPEARRAALKRCFEALDKDKSGSLECKEVKQYLFKTGVNIAQISGKAEDLMRKMDLDQDEVVSLEEFTAMMEALLADRSDDDLEVWVAEVVYTITSRNVVGFGNSLGDAMAGLSLPAEHMSLVRACFRQLDRDTSGYVELPELKVLLGKSGLDLDAMSDEVMALMAKLDKNGDNRVSEQEFYVTLSAIRKSLKDDAKFVSIVDNVLTVASRPGGADRKPELTEVLLSDV